VILKSLSRKSRVGAIVRYVLQVEKLERPKSKVHHERPLYVPGVKFTAKDLLYLKRELEDAIMMKECKEHISRGGTLKEFIVQQMYGEKPGKEGGALVITHNLRSKSVSGYTKEFEAINDLRIHTRSGQVKIYHEIMSWNAKDSHLLTDAHLRAMAEKFIELRGRGNAFLISKHANRDHVHLHFLISGTQMNGLSSRVAKQNYANIQLEMDRFQRTMLPELVNSLPAHGKKAAKEKEAEKLYKNDERLSVKNFLLKCLDETYSTSASKDHFFTQLKSQQIEPYERGGKLTGVIYEGYKFRLNRLDYTEEKLNFLDERKAQQEKALQEINNIRNKIRETGITKDFQDKDGNTHFKVIRKGRFMSLPTLGKVIAGVPGQMNVAEMTRTTIKAEIFRMIPIARMITTGIVCKIKVMEMIMMIGIPIKTALMMNRMNKTMTAWITMTMAGMIVKSQLQHPAHRRQSCA